MYRYSTLNFFVAMVAITQAIPQHTFMNELHASQLRRILGVEDLNDAPEYEIVYPQVLTSEGNYGINTEAIAEDSLNINVEAFGETLHLTVQKDNSLFSPDFYAEEISGEGGPPVPVPVRLDCLYTGKVTSESDSIVSLSTSSGLTAIIYHANGPTFIEPLAADLITDRGRPHIAYKKDERRKLRCGTAGSRHQGMEFPFHSSDAVHVNGQKTIELGVFTDVEAYKKKGNTIESGVTALLNLVRIFFKEPSLGLAVEIKLISLHIYKDTDPGFTKDLEKSIDVAAADQYARNVKSDSDPKHWDNALYLTGHVSDSYLGVAYPNTCSSGNSVALVVWGGGETAEVIAHELGHNINMEHDSDGNTCPSSGFVMASVGVGFTTWSACSKAYFETFLGREAATRNDLPTSTDKILVQSEGVDEMNKYQLDWSDDERSDEFW